MTIRPHQIVIKGDPIIKEGIATESITPGDLLDYVAGSAATLNSTYLTPYVKKHAGAGRNAQARFALEQDYIGTTPPGVIIDKTYANLDQVRYGHFRPGDEVFARLKASENVSYGAYLESAGDGTLRIASVASPASIDADSRIVCRALEASNSGSVARLIVEVL